MLKELTLVLLPMLLIAQETYIYRDSKLLSNSDLKNLAFLERTNETRNHYKTNTDSTVTDTIYLVPDTTALVTQFGFYGQDRMLQWFKAPADLFLKKIGFAFCGSWSNNTPVEIKLIKSNYPEDSLVYLNNEQYGWYEAIGNGYNDITAFADDPDRTGGWISVNPTDSSEVFEHCFYWLWGDCLYGYLLIPEPDSINVTYQWFDMAPIGYPDIQAGTIFGVSLKNTFPVMEDGRIEIRGTEVGSGGTNQYSLWKFYANCNNLPPPAHCYGWWSRDITLGFAVIVDIYGPLESYAEEDKPNTFSLVQNYPNPFNPSTTIKYSIQHSSHVSLKIYDILGNEVATLVNDEKSAGSYEVEFDGKELTSGVYFYQLKAGNYIETKKMVLTK